jgi:hypothetical protein
MSADWAEFVNELAVRYHKKHGVCPEQLQIDAWAYEHIRADLDAEFERLKAQGAPVGRADRACGFAIMTQVGRVELVKAQYWIPHREPPKLERLLKPIKGQPGR